MQSVLALMQLVLQLRDSFGKKLSERCSSTHAKVWLVEGTFCFDARPMNEFVATMKKGNSVCKKNGKR